MITVKKLTKRNLRWLFDCSEYVHHSCCSQADLHFHHM